MFRYLATITAIIVATICVSLLTSYAAVDIPGTTKIAEWSIGVSIWTDGSIASAKDAGDRKSVV